MKVCVVQPKYCLDYAQSDLYFEKLLELFAQCDDSMDIIVFPESCDIPCLAKTKEDAEVSVEKYNEKLLEVAAATAKRCNALLFVNARSKTEKGLRNTTHVFDRCGNLVGQYHKQHLVPSEVSVMELDSDYTFEHSAPTVMEIEGIRFGFLVCYDAYFYEAFPNMAKENLDVIIACSHQRSDTHKALEIMSQFLAYNTNTYVIRASVSMDENSDIGGASMVVAPTGEVLCNMHSRVGLETVEIDVSKKYYKPAGYGNPDAAHYQYIEQGRRPWKYRPAGSAIIKTDKLMPYPRVCAHRGYSAIAPENTMPAFGAAVGMGAPEIEFDLWPTLDGEIVSCHDRTLERVSTGEGEITAHTLAELQQLDFGVNFDEKFKGLGIVLFEDILKKFACHVIMNIHIKPITLDGTPYPEAAMKKIVELIRKYDAQNHVYFMLTPPWIIEQFRAYAPDIPVCAGNWYKEPWGIVDRAIKFGCEKVQMIDPYYNQEMVDKAHAHGIICNFCIVEDVELAQKLMDMNFDTLLADDYLLISNYVKNMKKS